MDGGENRLANTLNISFRYLEGESILVLLDQQGICASTGSACTAGSSEPSHVLRAMKVPADWLQGAVRFSLEPVQYRGRSCYVNERLPAIVQRLQGLSALGQARKPAAAPSPSEGRRPVPIGSKGVAHGAHADSSAGRLRVASGDLSRRQEPEKCCSIARNCQTQGVPKKFLEKIIQDLIRAGLIKSKRGSCGGYTLARSADAISFYDVIEAIEGPIAVNACMDHALGCDQMPRCTMIGVWSEVQRNITEVLTRTTMADLQANTLPGIDKLLFSFECGIMGEQNRAGPRCQAAPQREVVS